MRLGEKRWIAPAVSVVLACATIVSAAGGHASGPVARIACAQSATSCQESGSDTLPANGYGSQSTDTVPTKSTSGTEYVAPLSQEELASFDSNWETIVGAYPKLGGIKNVFVRRVLTCAVFAPNVSELYKVFRGSEKGQESARNTDTSQLFLTMCLQVVYETQLAEAKAAAASAGAKWAGRTASSGCAQTLQSIPILIKRNGSAYEAQVSGTPQPARKAPLVVSCRKRGPGIQISMRPRARGQTLRQVIGGHMSIGFSNPTNKPVGFHTVFSFR